MKEKAKMFWDSVNGKYTSDDTGCPSYKGRVEGIYVETWGARNSKEVIDFSFSQLEKDIGIVWRMREEHFRRYNFKPCGVVRLILPPKFYDEMYERFIKID